MSTINPGEILNVAKALKNVKVYLTSGTRIVLLEVTKNGALSLISSTLIVKLDSTILVGLPKSFTRMTRE